MKFSGILFVLATLFLTSCLPSQVSSQPAVTQDSAIDPLVASYDGPSSNNESLPPKPNPDLSQLPKLSAFNKIALYWLGETAIHLDTFPLKINVRIPTKISYENGPVEWCQFGIPINLSDDKQIRKNIADLKITYVNCPGDIRCNVSDHPTDPMNFYSKSFNERSSLEINLDDYGIFESPVYAVEPSSNHLFETLDNIISKVRIPAECPDYAKLRGAH